MPKVEHQVISTAYRKETPPCEKCERREQTSKQLAPFTDKDKCPACNHIHVQMAQFQSASGTGAVHTGGRIRHGGFKLFGRFWFVRYMEECDIEVPHFHLSCSRCGHAWKTKTNLKEEK